MLQYTLLLPIKHKHRYQSSKNRILYLLYCSSVAPRHRSNLGGGNDSASDYEIRTHLEFPEAHATAAAATAAVRGLF